jgi:hypothetical protein
VTVYLSEHAMRRLRERHDRHLLPYTDEASFRYSCLELFNGRAVESKRHLNDTALMAFLGEKYGHDQRFSFRVYRNALFVIRNGVCATVLDTEQHSFSRQFRAPRPAPTGRKPMSTFVKSGSRTQGKVKRAVQAARRNQLAMEE